MKQEGVLRYSWGEIAVGAVAWLAVAWLIYLGSISYSGGCIALEIVPHQEQAQQNSNRESCWDQQGWWNGKFFTDIRVTDVLLAAFTGLLVLIGYVQAKRLRETVEVTEQSVETAQQALALSVDRPWLFVSGVFQASAEVYAGTEGASFVAYQAANHGKAPAVVQQVWASFSAGEITEPDAPMRADENHGLFVRPILGVGEVREGLISTLPDGIPVHIIQSDKDVTYTGSLPRTVIADARPVIGRDEELFLWVQVEYRGPSTEGHFTSACWRWHDGEGHFVQFGGKEYNYNR